MANRRIHDLEDTATTLDSGAYIAVDSDSYTAAKKFAANKLPDPTGATDGYVWTADGADGAAWEAVSGGASDVTDLTTTTGSSTNMVRVAAAGGLEYRTVAQVLSDIGALAATGSVTGATSSAQTFTNGIVGPTWKPASDSTTALRLQTSGGTAVVTVDTSNSLVGINKTPSSTTLDVTRTTSAADQTGMKSVIVASGTGYHSSLNFQCQIYNVAASASYGMSGFASINSTSATTSAVYLYGGQFQVAAGTSGGYNTSATIAAAINVARPFHGTGGGTNSFSESYGVRIENVGSTNVNSSTITTAAGVRIADQSGATNTYAIYTGTGHVRFGDRLTVIQDSATAAVPVLTLQQDDDSEDMIEFTGTVGTGNAIEAVGAKTLTTTHFIKCTITGVGNVYIPVGTIA